MEGNILLALLPPWGDNSLAPLGISCISSNLVKSGHHVIKKDFNAAVYSDVILSNDGIFSNSDNLFDESRYNDVVLPVLNRYLCAWVDEILKSRSSIVGFTAYCTNILTIKNISKMLKGRAPDIVIVVGGPETSRTSEFITWGCIDFGVIGDGEITMSQLVNALVASDTDYTKIRGLVYRDPSTHEIINTGDNTIPDIDDLPYPDYEGINLSDYKWNSIPIEGSRGCINRCAFCGDVLLRKKYRSKSGRRIFDEVSHFINLGHRAFSFMDSLINGNIPELEIFCDLVIDHRENNGKTDIIWGGNACFRKEMTLSLLTKMRKAGCIFLNYGLESGSDDVLKMMNKRFTTDLAAEVIRNTKQSGIDVNLFMLIGFPTETEINFRETLDLITEHREYINLVFAGEGCVIYENSDLHKNPEKYGIYWEYDQVADMNDHNWNSKETTPSIRTMRVKEFVRHCKSNGIKSEDLLDKLNIKIFIK